MMSASSTSLRNFDHDNKGTENLFDIQGATINIYPVERYVPLGQDFSFQELVAHAYSFGESAIGYRIDLDHREDPQAGVRLNPSNSTRFTTASGDGLIVVGPATV